MVKCILKPNMRDSIDVMDELQYPHSAIICVHHHDGWMGSITTMGGWGASADSDGGVGSIGSMRAVKVTYNAPQTTS